MRQNNFFNNIISYNWQLRNLKSIIFRQLHRIFYGLWKLQNIQSISWIIRCQRFGSLRITGSRPRTQGNEGWLRRLGGFRIESQSQVMPFYSAECTDSRSLAQVNTMQCTQINVYRYRGRGCGLWPLSDDESYARSLYLGAEPKRFAVRTVLI